MSKADTFENVTRFMFGWPDGTLERDWRSTYSPIGLGSAAANEAMREIARRYLRMRRKAGGFRARRYDSNSHRTIPNADVLALLTDAQRLDRGEGNGNRHRRPGRPRKATGTRRECAVCGGVFTARRVTARFCGPACRQQAQRGRQKAGNVTLCTRETPRSTGLDGHSVQNAPNDTVSVTDG